MIGVAADCAIFKTQAKCSSCGQEIKGELAINLDTLVLADTRGFMVFADGVTCDNCIKKHKADELNSLK